MKYTKKEVELLKYKWGLGIEHEMHIFHQPKYSKKNIKDYILFDSYDVVERILKEKENTSLNINFDDYYFLKNEVPYETSGRKCNNIWVIKTVPVKMPEFITSHPFCSIKEDRNIINLTEEIVQKRKRFYKLLLLDDTTQKLVKKYGDLCEYPFGMTRYLKCPIDKKNGKYLFETDSAGNPILVPEYNGSYHITMTLPYKEDIKKIEFIKMHQNFANQLQWLEPLMLTSYFTGDEYSPGSLKTRVRGSFRVMIIGWGNFAGSDVRLFEKGIGRYSKTPTYWRKNLKFKDVEKLKPCYKPSPLALKEGAITSLSSDFRTFGSTDPLRPEHRESGIGMTKPNGIEFRIFDHFSDKYIKHLLMLISLVAENSRVKKTSGYVYENKVWINELHNIMKNGYKAKISNDYINLLRKKLDLKIDTESIIAIDIFKQIYKELWDKNINGDWSKIFHSLNKPPKYENIIIPEINKKGWQFAFMTMLNNDAKLMHKFNVLSNFLNYKKIIEYKDFEIAVLEIFGKNWADDVEDIAYFYSSIYFKSGQEKFIELIKNRKGIILNINLLLKIPKFNNFNKQIIDYFGEDILSNIL